MCFAGFKKLRPAQIPLESGLKIFFGGGLMSGSRGRAGLANRPTGFIPCLSGLNLSDLGAHDVQIDVQILERLVRNAALFLEQRQQQVLGTYFF